MTVRQRAKRKPVRVFSGGYWIGHEYDADGRMVITKTKIVWGRKGK